MYVDDNGIARFESLDTIAPLQVGLNTALETVSNQLDQEPLDKRLADILEMVDGETRAKILAFIGDTSQSQFPFKIATGRTVINPTAGNTPTSVYVTLPAGLFDSPPDVVPGMNTSVPGTILLGVGVTGVTTEGFNLYGTRTNTTGYQVYWIAIEVQA